MPIMATSLTNRSTTLSNSQQPEKTQPNTTQEEKIDSGFSGDSGDSDEGKFNGKTANLSTSYRRPTRKSSQNNSNDLMQKETDAREQLDRPTLHVMSVSPNRSPRMTTSLDQARKQRQNSAESLTSLVSNSKSPLKLKRQTSALSLSLRRLSQAGSEASSPRDSHKSSCDTESISDSSEGMDLFVTRKSLRRSDSQPVIQIGGFEGLSLPRKMSQQSLVASPIQSSFVSDIQLIRVASPVPNSPVGRLYPCPSGSVLNLASPHNALYEERERKANAAMLRRQRERKAKEAGMTLEEEEPEVKKEKKPREPVPETVVEEVVEETVTETVEKVEEVLTLVHQVKEEEGPVMERTTSTQSIDSTWTPDSARPTCVSCNLTFRVFRRRHHCRICLDVFCSNCSSKTIVIDRIPKRACNACFGKQS